ncbi:MAG: histidine phosphatase family protein, partial [Mesorhizobium sp.]
MSSAYPEIYLVRHGETEWSLSGRHTGRTDIPLTAKGEEAARGVADRLKGLTFQ